MKRPHHSPTETEKKKNKKKQKEIGINVFFCTFFIPKKKGSFSH